MPVKQSQLTSQCNCILGIGSIWVEKLACYRNNWFQILTLNTEHSIFDVGAVLDASPIFLPRDKSIDITIASMKISLNIQIHRNES